MNGTGIVKGFVPSEKVENYCVKVYTIYHLVDIWFGEKFSKI